MPDTVAWAIADLRPHPENETIFGNAKDSPEYDRIRKSIKTRGLDEPIVVRPDGTILSGHLRVEVYKELGKKYIEARERDFGGDYYAELRFVVGSNTDRRHLTPEQIAWGFDRLTKLAKEHGGTKRKPGARTGNKNASKKDKNNPSSSRQVESKRADADAAEAFGVGRDEARALQAVFIPADVPADVKTAVNRGVAPTPAAKAVKAERARQGGTITDPTPLKAWAEAKAQPKPPADHDKRVADQAAAFTRDMAELVEVYKRLHAVVSRRPLASVIGPTEHHEYTRYLRDVALLAWGQVESVTGDTKVGKQMALQVIDGGKA